MISRGSRSRRALDGRTWARGQHVTACLGRETRRWTLTTARLERGGGWKIQHTVFHGYGNWGVSNQNEPLMNQAQQSPPPRQARVRPVGNLSMGLARRSKRACCSLVLELQGERTAAGGEGGGRQLPAGKANLLNVAGPAFLPGPFAAGVMVDGSWKARRLVFRFPPFWRCSTLRPITSFAFPAAQKGPRRNHLASRKGGRRLAVRTEEGASLTSPSGRRHLQVGWTMERRHCTGERGKRAVQVPPSASVDLQGWAGDWPATRRSHPRPTALANTTAAKTESTARTVPVRRR